MKKKKVDFLLGFRARECGGQVACGYNSVGVSMQLCKEPQLPFPSSSQAHTQGKTLRRFTNTLAPTKLIVRLLGYRIPNGPLPLKEARFPLRLQNGWTLC